MADERNDYYDVIREKITDPELQKALDAFHARGAAEQRQRSAPAASPSEPRSGAAGQEPFRPEYRAPSDGGRGAADEFRPRDPARPRPRAGMPTRQGTVPSSQGPREPGPAAGSSSQGPRESGLSAPNGRESGAYRQYMQRQGRKPGFWDSEEEKKDYNAAYREAVRKESERRAAKARETRGRLIMGVVVIAFALFGLGSAVFFGVKGVSALRTKRSDEQCAAYNARLICVAAVDPDAFDDITAASMEDLIRISVWRLIGSGFDPNRYTYENGELRLPQAEVEASYAALFGNQLPIVHQTAEGYGYTIQYSADDAAYFIPMTTLEPLYTPKVTSVETKSGATVVTCGMISSGLWKQDGATGDITVPDPDKYIRVTFRTANGAEYISSLQSLGMPETALPSGGTAPAPGAETETEPAAPVETTTEKQIVITWD